MGNRAMLTGRCRVCDQEMMGFYDEDAPSWAVLAKVCPGCAPRFPESLLKATHDPFDYALQLKTGDVFRFEQAQLAGEWVHLEGVSEWDHVESHGPDAAYSFDRGMDVRIADIVWCCDAPRGS